MAKRSVTDRFQRKYTVDEKTGCWLWNGGKDPDGYGRVMYLGKRYVAHRLYYQMHTGVDPKGMCVCHKCDTPSCVNPDHLFLGTTKENTEDKVRKGRQAKGSRSGKSKLQEADVFLIKRFIEKYPPSSSSLEMGHGVRDFLARWFGVTKFCISQIMQERTWGHIK